MNDNVVNINPDEQAKKENVRNYTIYVFTDQYDEKTNAYVEAKKAYYKVTGYQVNGDFIAIVQNKLTTLLPIPGITRIEIKE